MCIIICISTYTSIHTYVYIYIYIYTYRERERERRRETVSLCYRFIWLSSQHLIVDAQGFAATAENSELYLKIPRFEIEILKGRTNGKDGETN